MLSPEVDTVTVPFAVTGKRYQTVCPYGALPHTSVSSSQSPALAPRLSCPSSVELSAILTAMSQVSFDGGVFGGSWSATATSALLSATTIDSRSARRGGGLSD